MNTYDPKCEELARYFLPDSADDGRVQEVAVAIQQAIEDELTLEETELRDFVQPLARRIRKPPGRAVETTTRGSAS